MNAEQKEFIKNLNEQNYVPKLSEVKAIFPRLFPIKLEVGKWYRLPDGYEETSINYEILIKSITKDGFFEGSVQHEHFEISDGEWAVSSWSNTRWSQQLIEMTGKEIHEALKIQFNKKGYSGGAQVRGDGDKVISISEFWHVDNYNRVWAMGHGENVIVFSPETGWVDIVTTITKEEAEKKLGMKIVD